MPLTLPPAPPPAEIRPFTASELKNEILFAAGLNDPLAAQPANQLSLPADGSQAGEKINLSADAQDYAPEQDKFNASGHVRMDFRNSVLFADQLQVDLKTRIAIATGNIKLIRGIQQINGERVEYNFALNEGVLYKASGLINTKPPQRDRPLPDTAALLDQPIGYGGSQKGKILRFRADTISFNAQGWTGENVRITNDPFDPPEVELLSQKAVATTQADGTTLLETTANTLQLDQAINLPAPGLTRVIGDDEDETPWVIGYDSLDRGGLYYQQNFRWRLPDKAAFRILPRFFLQRIFNGNTAPAGYSFNNLATQAQAPDTGSAGENFGLGLQYQTAPGRPQRTSFFADWNGLSFEDLGRRIRLRAEQKYTFEDASLTVSYAYRERVFNGIFGIQPISQRWEASLNSRLFAIDPGTNLNIATSVSLFQAPSDRGDLGLAQGPSTTPEITLGRFQVYASVTRGITLLQADPTPATQEFLRYSPYPITPNLGIYPRLTGVFSAYSSGDSQASLEAGVYVTASVGQFARDLIDFTQVSFYFGNTIFSGQSPFLFDRIRTSQFASASILQQIFGPLRIGYTASWDLSSGQQVDRRFTIQIDRRTYGFSFSYSPVQQTGLLEFRLDDFNWAVDQVGRPYPPEVRNGVSSPVK